MSQESLESTMSTMTITNTSVDLEVARTSSHASFSLLHALPVEALFHCASYLSNVELQSLAMVDRYCREHVLLLQQNDTYAPVYHIDRIFKSYMEAYQNKEMLSTIKNTILGVQKVAFDRNAYSNAILWALNYCRSHFNMTDTDAVATVIRVSDTLFDCLVNATHFTGAIVVNHTRRGTCESDTIVITSSISDYLPTLVLEDISSAESNLMQTRMDALRWNHLRIGVDEAARTMPRFPCLKALDVEDNNVDEQFLQSLLAHQLESLTVVSIKKISPKLQHTIKLTQLKRLTLKYYHEDRCCPISDVLDMAPNVEQLTIISCYTINLTTRPSELLRMRANEYLRVLDVSYCGDQLEAALDLFRALPGQLEEFYFSSHFVMARHSLTRCPERPVLPASLRVVSVNNFGYLAVPFSLANSLESKPHSLEVTLAFSDARSIRLSDYDLQACTSLTLFSGDWHFTSVGEQLASLNQLRHFAYHAMTAMMESAALQQSRSLERFIGTFRMHSIVRLEDFPQLHVQDLPSSLESLHVSNVIVCEALEDAVESRLQSLEADLRHAYKVVDGCIHNFIE